MKVCFISTSTVDPKTQKRIVSFQKYGDVIAIYAKRKSHNTDIIVDGCRHIPIEIDLPDSNHVVKRLAVSRVLQKEIYKQLCNIRPDIIYAESFDALQVASKYRIKHHCVLFFEVADLRTVQFKEQRGIKNKIIAGVLKHFESKYFRQVNYLVVTSEKFYEERYKELIDKENVIFSPNMPDRTAFKDFHSINHQGFTVGFVGGLRYINQMIMLVDAAEKTGINVVFSGTPYDKDSSRLINYCKDKAFVEFTGEYNFQKEIASIYGRLDCVYSVYDAALPNVRIALPNKLYEAVLCERPIIVAKDTYLCELAENLGVGIGVKYDDVNDLSCVLEKLRDDKEFYNTFVVNCRKNKDKIDYSLYNEVLEDKIRKSIEKNELSV